MPILTVEENGLHSLAKSLEAFQKLHASDGKDKYALKDAILMAYHGAETLCKGVLYRINPALIVKSTEKNLIPNLITIYTAREWHFETIALSETLERLHKIFGQHGLFESDDYQQLKQACEKLQKDRNDLQHFQFEGDEQSIALVLGAFIPRLIDVLEKTNRQENILNVIYPQGEKVVDFLARRNAPPLIETLNSIYPESQKIVQLLREEYDDLYKKAMDGICGLNLKDVGQNIKLNYETFSFASCQEKLDGFINFNVDSALSSMFSRGNMWHAHQSDFEAHHCKLKLTKLGVEPHSVPMFQTTVDGNGQEQTTPILVGAKKHSFHVFLEVETSLKNVISHLNLGENTPWLRFIKNMIVRTRADIQFSGRTWDENENHFLDVAHGKTMLEIQLQLIPNGVDPSDIERHIFCTIKPEILKLVKFDANFRSWDGLSQESLGIDLICETKADIQFSRISSKSA